MEKPTAPIHLRRCRPDEWATLQTIGRQTFIDAFADQNTPENLYMYLEAAFQTERVQAELANPASQFWWVEQGEQIVGYMKLNLAGAQTEAQPESTLEIERIYVVQGAQRAGLGQLLFEKALELARAAGAHYLWLGVWEHNLKAIRFYERNGLRPFGQHPFFLGREEQTDLLMRRAV